MKQQRHRITFATVTAAAVIAMAASTPALAGSAATTSLPTVPLSAQNAASEIAASEIEKKWGVKVVSIRLTALGQYLDFRYKVIDPNKAAPILNRNNEPRMIDQKSGRLVNIGSLPKLGRLRQNTRKPVAGRTYFMLFKNPGFVRAGNKVAVEVGNFRIENLTVEG